MKQKNPGITMAAAALIAFLCSAPAWAETVLTYPFEGGTMVITTPQLPPGIAMTVKNVPKSELDTLKKLKNDVPELNVPIAGIHFQKSTGWLTVKDTQYVTDFLKETGGPLLIRVSFKSLNAGAPFYFVPENGPSAKFDTSNAAAEFKQYGFFITMKRVKAAPLVLDFTIYNWPPGDPLCGGG